MMTRDRSKFGLNDTGRFGAIGLAWMLVACGGDLLVGDPPKDGDKDQDVVEPWTPPAPYVGSGECAAEDELTRERYESWRRKTNDFSQLSGTSWRGRLATDREEMQTSTMRLDIARDQTATVTFGEGASPPPATEASEGYLCDGPTLECQIDTDGVPYPVHDAQFDENELTMSLLRTSPWTDWCALQTPNVWDEEAPPLCQRSCRLS